MKENGEIAMNHVGPAERLFGAGFGTIIEPGRCLLGGWRIPQEMAAELVDRARDDLTPREVDVLRLIANGNANKQIADQLSIGEASVKSYVANILAKLGASDRAHAVTIGLKRGIIELEIP